MSNKRKDTEIPTSVKKEKKKEDLTGVLVGFGTSKKGTRQNIIALDTGAKVDMFIGFMKKTAASELFDKLKLLLDEYGKIERGMIYGREWVSKRRTIQFVLPGAKTYVYNGAETSEVKRAEFSLCPQLEEIRQRFSTLFDQEFNLGLMMHYPDGKTGLGWHNDDERGLNGWIVAIVVGRGRDVCFRDQKNKKTWQFCPESGDVYAFNDLANQQLQHCVPVRKNDTGERICLTLRTMDEIKDTQTF